MDAAAPPLPAFASLAAGAGVLMAMLVCTPVQAQTSVSVSNIPERGTFGNHTIANFRVIRGIGAEFWEHTGQGVVWEYFSSRATRFQQRFTTGDATNGYDLASVSFVTFTKRTTHRPTVRVCKTSNGIPGTPCKSLTYHNTRNLLSQTTWLPGEPIRMTYHSTGDTFKLDPDTQYSVEVRPRPVPGKPYLYWTWPVIYSNAESGTDGFSIADDLEHKLHGEWRWNFHLLQRWNASLPMLVVASNRSSARSASPSAASTVIGTPEDTPYVFQPSDFGFSNDAKRDRSSHVTLASLPGAGTLTVNGSAASQHQIVDKTDIGDGALVFTPASNEHGDGYASFTFRAYNGRTESAAATVTINVFASNDPPSGVPVIAGTPRVGETATIDVSGISDPDGLSDPRWSYRWMRFAQGPGVFVEGATQSAYVLGADDAGAVFRPEVSWIDDDGTREVVLGPVWPSEGSVAGDAPVLRAEFRNVPEAHDGSAEFAVHLHFSMELSGLSYGTLGAHFASTNASIRKARRLTLGSNRDWELMVAPLSSGDITLTLPPRACSSANPICLNGAPLAAAATVSVPYAAPRPTVVTPLTAVLSGVPEAHSGAPFSFELVLSEDVPGLSYRTIGASAFAVTGGALAGAQRLVRRSNQRWRVHVAPSGLGDVTVALAATTDCAATGAICTRQGRRQSSDASVTVSGPALSVLDASAREGTDATMAFAVSLTHAAAQPITVDYATSDGTALAGHDYTAASGTLRFAAGETTKTVSVTVLDDIHDESSETFDFTLSNPVPSAVRLAAATATGMIHNTDAMPSAWLARFGRTVAEQVLGAVEGRMHSGVTPGFELSLAGVPIGWHPGSDGAAPLPGDADLGGRGGFAPSSASRGVPGVVPSDAPDRARSASWEDGEGFAGALSPPRSLTGRDLLLGSSFAFAAQPGGPGPDAGTVGLWGSAAVSHFAGEEGALSIDGEVASALLGADWRHARAAAGLIFGYSLGEGGYDAPARGGVVSSTLTGLYPWGRYALSERLDLWGVGGYGAGTLELTPDGHDPIRADLDLWMAASGIRGVLLDGGDQGLTLASKADALAVRTSTDAARGLAASRVDVNRVRLALEATSTMPLAGGASFVPSAEIGVRHDGGDAERGFGIDIGAGVAWSDPHRGLRADFRARGLLTHEADDFRDRGLSASFDWAPGRAGRGPRASLAHTIGGASSGAADAVFAGAEFAAPVSDDDELRDLELRSVEARFGYGFPAFDGRFTWTPHVVASFSNDARHYGVGWSLVHVARKGRMQRRSPELSFSAVRHEARADAESDPDHRLGLWLRASF